MAIDTSAPAAVPLTVGIAVQAAAAISMPLLFGASPWRRASAIGVALLGFIFPLALRVPGPPAVRTVLMGLGILGIFKLLDLLKMRTALSPLARVWYANTPFDTRATRRVPRQAPARLVVSVTAFSLASVLAAWALLDEPSPGPMRWGLGIVFVYCGLDAVTGLIRLGYGLGGIEIPSMHRAPILSRTLTEFWGQRWNRPVHGWLRSHCFDWLARKRLAGWGVLAAFVGSGVLHFLLTVVSTTSLPALAAGSFFLVQAALVAAERRLAVIRWPHGVARLWTFSAVVFTSPLLIEGTLQSLGF